MPKERRGYLLPSGCKDLIDVLKSNAKKSASIQVGASSPIKLTIPLKSKPKGKPLPSVFLSNTVVVKELASALGIKLYRLIDFLKEMKVFTSVNQRIPFYMAAKVAKHFGFLAQKKTN
jgi:hypothetical protein